LTSYLNRLVGSELDGAGRFDKFQTPDFLADLPFVGWIFEMLFDQGPIAMSVIVIVIFLQIMLFRSRWGLRTRAVGVHPKAADRVGVDVVRLRYRNVILGGALAGLAGGYLTLEATGTFQNGMTAGRGSSPWQPSSSDGGRPSGHSQARSSSQPRSGSGSP
jgi:simple sugar transport system permease protein